MPRKESRCRAERQDIRPLRILILNLMPTKIATETQLARLLGNTPIQIQMELLAVGHTPKHTAREHMLGRPGRPFPSLRHRQAAAARKDLRHFPAPGHP